MRKIDFKTLYIQNFLSIGNEPLEINFNNGLNVINGINKDEDDIANGSGKSTILDAFYFAIFGNTMRELSKLSFIVNRKTNKNCIVRLELEISDCSGTSEYLIERKLAPQGLKLWKDGSEITKSTVAETNKFIEELIIADKDIFQNCIVMRANNTTPFMAKKKQEKKSFIENIFNLNIFSLMSRYLKDDIRETKGQYALEQNTLNLHNNNLTEYNKELSRILKIQEEEAASKQVEIDELNKKIADEIIRKEVAVRDLIAKNNAQPEGNNSASVIESCDTALKQLKPIKTKFSVDIAVLERDYKKLENSENICPTCKREYPADYLEEIDNKKISIKEDIKELQVKLDAVTDKITEIEAKKESASVLASEINAWKTSILMAKREVEQCDNIIKLLQEQLEKKAVKREITGVENFRNLIKSAEDSIKEVKAKVNFLERELGKMNICEHVLGEYGVRAYIVNKLLDLFNNRIMYYLSAIKSTFNFRFNEFFEEEIKDANGIICLYNNCSGAEMKKIDLAISFAINDMLSLQKQVTYNVLFFDEILDSSLDDKSLNIILNFISEHTEKENKAVYIISHKSGAQIPHINEIITVEKVNGFTRRITE